MVGYGTGWEGEEEGSVHVCGTVGGAAPGAAYGLGARGAALTCSIQICFYIGSFQTLCCIQDDSGGFVFFQEKHKSQNKLLQTIYYIQGLWSLSL